MKDKINNLEKENASLFNKNKTNQTNFDQEGITRNDSNTFKEEKNSEFTNDEIRELKELLNDYKKNKTVKIDVLTNNPSAEEKAELFIKSREGQKYYMEAKERNYLSWLRDFNKSDTEENQLEYEYYATHLNETPSYFKRFWTKTKQFQEACDKWWEKQ